MKTIQLNKRSRSNVLHIEVDGVIVNIRRGLHDAFGHPVTSIDIQPGSDWHLPDFPGRKGINVRVARYELGERRICLRCDLEVEWNGDEWHDRGGNTSCKDGAKHDPFNE